MKHRTTYVRYSLSDDSGHALIELILVIPLLALIALSSLEFSIQLGSLQVATQLSRELASLTYRECVIDSTGSASVKFNPDPCIDRVLAEFVADSINIAPGAQFVASLYNINGASAQQASVRSSGTQGSKHVVSDFTSRNSSDPLVNALSNSVSELDRVVVVEVYLPHTELPGALTFLNATARNWIYASTVI